MGEVQYEAPAVASDDPANLTGPGVTRNPDDPSAVQGVAQIAEENARLRAQLLAENEALRAALADSRAAGAGLTGLSDEDVRRIEHPEEYLDEYAAMGEHESLKALVGSLADRLDQAHALIADVQSENAQLAQRQAEPAPRESVGVTADPVDDRSQTFASDDTTTAGAHNAVTDTPTRVADAGSSSDPFAGLSDAELSAELARREAGDTQ